MSVWNTHVVAMPRWTSFVGVARLILALLVLIFVSTAAGLWYSANFAAIGVTIFTASATLIIFAYYAVSLCSKPELYNAWAVLGLEIFGVIFWLVSFALCAEWTATFDHRRYWSAAPTSTTDNPRYSPWIAPFKPEDFDFDLRRRDIIMRSPEQWKAGVALMGTAAGLGALEFVLFIVVLVFFSINLHKHCVAGKPFVFGTVVTVRNATGKKPSLPTIITTPAEDSTDGKVVDSGALSETAEKKTASDDASAMV